MSQQKALKERAARLLRRAAELRAAGEHVGAGDVERDAHALLRMARADALVRAGTHDYHPLTGRIVPKNH